MIGDQTELLRSPVPTGSADGVRLRPDVSVHFLGEESVLFDPIAQRVYAANTSATYIWCSLEDGLPHHEIVHRVQETFGISRDVADTYFGTAVENWRQLGLTLNGKAGASQPPAPESDITVPGETVVVAPSVVETSYRLLDVTFRFGFPNHGLAHETAAILVPLASTGFSQTRIRLDLVPWGDGYIIARDGRKFRWCTQQDQVVPLIKTCMIELALYASGDFGAVHAAAVGRHNRCVLLPGVSGSGKSTLTAALVAAGLQLLGDDTVVLTPDELMARPVPFGICVKDGAWKLLSSRFPTLEELPIHNRLDGKRVRYLIGNDPESWAQPDDRFEIQSIAFIRRTAGARPGLSQISRSEALTRLTREFCLLADGLDTARIERLVEWIAGRDCYELSYEGLDDGVNLIKGLLT
jgi:hypothetical protein